MNLTESVCIFGSLTECVWIVPEKAVLYIQVRACVLYLTYTFACILINQSLVPELLLVFVLTRVHGFLSLIICCLLM